MNYAYLEIWPSVLYFFSPSKYPKSPGAPKQPLSGYVHFLNDHREEVRKEWPDMPVKEISKKFTPKKWSQLGQEEKQKYAKIAELDKERYRCEFLEYQQTDNYQKFIAHLEVAKNANEDLEKAMPLLPSKKSKKEDNESIHKGEKPFQCELCNTEFEEKRGFDEHVLNVHDGKIPFKCDICGGTFNRKKGLNHHKKCLGHDGKKLTFKCDLCGQSFAKKKGLNRHKNRKKTCTANGDPEKAMKKGNESIHKRKQHFQCSMCDKEFEEKRRLNDHVLNVHVHHCQICNEYFSKKHELKIHIAIMHEEIKPFLVTGLSGTAAVVG